MEKWASTNTILNEFWLMGGWSRAVHSTQADIDERDIVNDTTKGMFLESLSKPRKGIYFFWMMYKYQSPASKVLEASRLKNDQVRAVKQAVRPKPTKSAVNSLVTELRRSITHRQNDRTSVYAYNSSNNIHCIKKTHTHMYVNLRLHYIIFW